MSTYAMVHPWLTFCLLILVMLCTYATVNSIVGHVYEAQKLGRQMEYLKLHTANMEAENGQKRLRMEEEDRELAKALAGAKNNPYIHT